MGVSSDAILFYGYNLPSEEPLPEAADEYYNNLDNGKGEVSIGRHCHSEFPIYYVYWTASETTARRGYAQPIDIKALDHPHLSKEQIDALIVIFANKYSIQHPETGEADYERSSAIGWWLASYWDG